MDILPVILSYIFYGLSVLAFTFAASMCAPTLGYAKLYGAKIRLVDVSIVGCELTHKWIVQLLINKSIYL
jgi:hypothetical protein